MNLWLAVAAGGALGAVARYGLSTAAYAWLGRGFPWGTLIVNVLGSGLAGMLYVFLLERMNAAPEWRALVLVGFLGAFTTFSAFSIETFNLLESGEAGKAALNMVVSVLACVAAAWGGVVLARSL